MKMWKNTGFFKASTLINKCDKESLKLLSIKYYVVFNIFLQSL